MILMNLTDEYEQARNHVKKVNFNYTYTGSIPFFETVIRYVGGLLSAYHLSGDHVFLDAAETISAELLPVFGTVSGLPAFSVNLVGENKIGSGWNPGNVMLAEIASCQLEYKYLAHLTGKKDYFTKVCPRAIAQTEAHNVSSPNSLSNTSRRTKIHQVYCQSGGMNSLDDQATLSFRSAQWQTARYVCFILYYKVKASFIMLYSMNTY
jgi:hypothetical protein